MQHNLSLVEFLLNLHDAVCLFGVLVFGNVVFKFGKGNRCRRGRRGAVGPFGARMLGKKLVDDFGQELVGDESGIFVVGDYDAGDAFGAAVRVEGIGYVYVYVLVSFLASHAQIGLYGIIMWLSKPIVGIRVDSPGKKLTLFFNILPLAGPCSFCDCLGE